LPVLKGIRVLIVDDEPDARSVIKRLLENCQAVVTPAASADEAMALIQDHTFDVILSDIGMPGRDGHELIRLIRSLPPEKGGKTPAVALTAFARSEDRTRALLAGFDIHVAKPVEPSELCAVVARLAGRKEEGIKTKRRFPAQNLLPGGMLNKLKRISAKSDPRKCGRSASLADGHPRCGRWRRISPAGAVRTATFAVSLRPVAVLCPSGSQAPRPCVSGSSSAFSAAFSPARDVAEAEHFTRTLAESHYENFSVVSRLLPRALRRDFCNLYAFCRIADDLGDEVGDRQTALDYLGRFREATRECFAGRPGSAVFVALEGTIRRHDIPIDPFLDLIDAFEQDQRVNRYQSFEQVRAYCRRSADPVGRLVLYLCGYRDERRQQLSDCTCTALQLANFWQDVRRDLLDLDRIYLPKESMDRFGVSEEQLRTLVADARVRELIRFEVDRAEALFEQGEALLPLLDPSVRPQIALFGKGGRAILAAIRRQGYDTLSRRPVLSKWQKGKLVAGMLAGRAVGGLGGGGRAAVSGARP
jgi:squalene synthase HpnC